MEFACFFIKDKTHSLNYAIDHVILPTLDDPYQSLDNSLIFHCGRIGKCAARVRIKSLLHMVRLL